MPHAAALAAVLALATLALVAWSLFDSYRATRRGAQQSADAISLTLVREIGWFVGELDLALQAAARDVSAAGPARAFGGIGSSMFAGVFITDPQGRVIYDSRGPQAAAAAGADPVSFRAQQQHEDLGLTIGRSPHRPDDAGRHPGWDMDLMRRINRPDGSFAGVIVGRVHLDYVKTLFTERGLGRSGAIALFGADGRLLLRLPPVPLDPGRRLSNMPNFWPRGAAGQFEVRSPVDGVFRLGSYRRIGSLPLVVAVGLATRDVFAGWEGRAAVLCGVLAILLTSAAVLTWALRRELQRRDRAEQAARLSDQAHSAALARLDALFQHSTDAMFVARLGADGELVYETVNPAWEALRGRSAVRCLGRTPYDCLPPDAAAVVSENWRCCERERRPVRYTFSFTEAGRRRDVETFVAPVIDQRGQVRRLIGVTRDLTDRNRLEADLRQAQRADGMRQLTAGVAHDFNNLLQAILGVLELLQHRADLDPEAKDYLAMADGAARRGAALTHRLLAYVREQDLRPALLRPSQTLAETVELLPPVLSGARIGVEVDVAAAGWLIRADPIQLERCLFHLVVNARDAMPQGGTVRLSVADLGPADLPASLPPGDYVRFTVADEGVGMSPEILAQALEPFFTTKGVGKGTGLGLSMVQGFARQSGGDVAIESAVGRGTVVRIWLPRAAGVLAAPPAPAEPARSDHGRGRVLVVDDEPAVCRTVVLFLSKAGFTCTSADSGEAALALLQDNAPCDLLITDQSMPGMSGVELIERVAELRPTLPALLVTAYDLMSHLGRVQGRLTVLRKPFDRAPLIRQVESLIAASRQGSVPTPEAAEPPCRGRIERFGS